MGIPQSCRVFCINYNLVDVLKGQSHFYICLLTVLHATFAFLAVISLAFDMFLVSQLVDVSHADCPSLTVYTTRISVLITVFN